MIEQRLLGILVFATLSAASLAGQTESKKLPQPTGEYAVGTITYCWADETRRTSYSSFDSDLRRIPVQLWFPAEEDAGAAIAPYSALSVDYRHVETNSMLWPAFAEKATSCPLILISPGRGVERFGYTTIAEDLASHGYVVAAVDMPGIGYVIYPEGLTVKPDPEFRPSRELMAGPYEKVDEFFEKPTGIGLRDLEFALAKIESLQEFDPTGRFVGRIDMARVGIFGHSLGGRVAGALANQDERVRAYISMEGIAPRGARLNGLSMPVAMMCSSGTLPYAVNNYQSLIDGRKEVVYMIELQEFGHNSVTDFPYVTPRQFQYEIDSLSGLLTSVAIIRSFFDVHLRGEEGFARRSDRLENVIVTEHAAPETREKEPTSGGTRRPTVRLRRGSAFIARRLFCLPEAPESSSACAMTGYVESLNGKLRDELLSGKIFYTLGVAAFIGGQHGGVPNPDDATPLRVLEEAERRSAPVRADRNAA